jgi:hypothetical protein
MMRKLQMMMGKNLVVFSQHYYCTPFPSLSDSTGKVMAGSRIAGFQQQMCLHVEGLVFFPA